MIAHDHIKQLLLKMKAEDELENMPQLYIPKQRTFRQLRTNDFNSIRIATRSVDGTPVSLVAGKSTLTRMKEMHTFHNHHEDDEEAILEEQEEADRALKEGYNDFEVTLMFTRVA